MNQPTEKQPIELEKRLQAYRDYNRGIRDIYRDNIRTLDNQVLALSAGTLGLSLTFVGNLVELSSAIWIGLLILGWLALAISVIVVLAGLRYATSSETIKETLDAGQQLLGIGEYELSEENKEAAEDRSTAKDGKIDRFNKWAVRFFLVGMVAIVAFASINVGNQNFASGDSNEALPDTTESEPTPD